MRGLLIMLLTFSISSLLPLPASAKRPGRKALQNMRAGITAYQEARFDDGQRVMADVGLYEANPWGLHDMHGNVCEWTLSDYRPYPYRTDDGRNGGSDSTSKVVRGGSWRDRPKLARSAWRQGYRPYQRVYNVGFRVVVQP